MVIAGAYLHIQAGMALAGTLGLDDPNLLIFEHL